MRSNFLSIFASCLVFVFACTGLRAQDDTLGAAAGDRYVISARAGNVNFVQGVVGIVRKLGKRGLLVKGDRLEIGDRVSTGPDGRAEVLLNPGSFIRLDRDSTFEFQTTSLDDLKLRLESGSAILEVYATEEFKVEVNTPKTTYELIQTGIYRIDVADGGATRMEVWKGRAQVGAWPDMVKAGRAVTTDVGGTPSIAKFDRGDRDAFETWSRDRGRELTRVTSGLRTVNLTPNLMGGFREGWWNLYSTFGLWIFDPSFGGYTFLPFGHRWNSPYGWGYDNCIHNYNLPPIVYSTPPNLPHQNQTPSNTSTGSSAPPTTLGNPHHRGGDGQSPPASIGTHRVPAYMRLEETMGGGRGGAGGASSDSGGSGTYGSGSSGSGSSSSSSGSSSGSSSPPPSSPPSSPPSTLGDSKVDRGGKP